MDVLDVQELKKIYYGEYQLNGISFSLGEGTAMAVLGGQCAGKTPLLEVLAGRKRADSGVILYKGKDIHSLKADDWKGIAFVPDDYIYYEKKTVKRLLERTVRWNGVGAAEDAKELCDMFHIDIEAELLTLSDRDRKCVAVMNGLIVRPDLLILDEMYHGLDEKTYLNLLDIIDAMRRRGMAVIYACEEYEQISGYCDQYLLMQEGDCVVAGRVGRNDKPFKMVVVMMRDFLQKSGEAVRERCQEFIMACRRLENAGDVRILKNRVCFPYHGDMAELTRLMYEFQCEDYLIEQMSLEEAVLHNYKRWSE